MPGPRTGGSGQRHRQGHRSGGRGPASGRPGGRGGPRPGGPIDGRSDTQVATRPSHVELPSVLTVKELADTLTVEPVQVMKLLIKNGMMATINQEIDFDTAAIVASELGVEATEQKLQPVDTDDRPAEASREI